MCKIFYFECLQIGQNNIVCLELPPISLKYPPPPHTSDKIISAKDKEPFLYEDFYFLPNFDLIIKFEKKIPFLPAVSRNLQATIPNKQFFKDIDLMYYIQNLSINQI